jgi:UPF0176 protein
MTHSVIAYYILLPIENPVAEMKLQRAFLSKIDAKARIYISKEGINGQLSIKTEEAALYIDWMHGRTGFEKADFKVHLWHDHPFPKLTIKVRKELVASDRGVDLSKRASHISPEEFDKTLSSDEPYLLFDVRNDYEWEVGHFEGAEKTPCATFRQFHDWAHQLAAQVEDKKTKVLMYCTGGIRCEFFSPMMKEAGFENVHQLDGGVIGYGLRKGSQHWKGKLFVFDDRMTVPLSDEPTESCGSCHKCKAPVDDYFNCANMDCNALFLSCRACLKELQGCCKADCITSSRVRPYAEQDSHRPFRKWFNYFDEKNTLRSL